jgi:hypothetical protein
VKVLFTGRGTSGSWQIRAVQIGRAIGADVLPDARDVAAYDLTVLVKRSAAGQIERIHRAGVPLVWDVVDAWPQPDGNNWSEGECKAWLAGQVKQLRPVAIVVATAAMAADCAGFGVPVLHLPHHARPAQRLNPIRERVEVVGYEGGEQYLGAWRSQLETECMRRGWRFVVNPTQLADLDIVVALRQADGYAPRNWKSNVKAANAQATGTPMVANREQGYVETDNGALFWAGDAEGLAHALDALTPADVRRAASRRLLEAAPAVQLEHVAKGYALWLSGLKF